MTVQSDMAITGPANTAEAVTKLDSTDLAQPARGFYIGGTAGNVKVTTVGGSDITFPNMLVGVVYPIAVTKIWSGGTTATSLIALR